MMTRLTFTGQEEEPVWSPDGSHLAFWSISGDRSVIAWTRAARGLEMQVLLDSPNRTAASPARLSMVEPQSAVSGVASYAGSHAGG
jgi:hypothetical protein